MANLNVHSSSSEPSICSICLDELKPGAEVARPSVCSHFFCRTCLEKLCQQNSTPTRCPLDRKPFDSICVQRWKQTPGTVLPQKLLSSHAVAIGIGVYLLVVLGLSPNWLLVAHIAATYGAYFFTPGIEDWGYYSINSFAFYTFLVPWKFFGLTVACYAWCCGGLIVHWGQQISRMQASGHWQQDKRLLIVTCLLISVIYPAQLFSAYELAQIYSYVMWLVQVCCLLTNLLADFGQPRARHAFLLSTLLLAPFLCSRQELTLSHLGYNCLVTGYLGVSYRPQATVGNTQQQLFSLNTELSKVACLLLLLTKAYGLSSGLAVYVALLLTYLQIFICPMSVATSVQERFPLLLFVNIAVVVILLPCQVFGYLAYTKCVAAYVASKAVMNCLLSKVLSRPDFQATLIAIQFAVFVIVIPGVLFA